MEIHIIKKIIREREKQKKKREKKAIKEQLRIQRLIENGYQPNLTHEERLLERAKEISRIVDEEQKKKK